MGKYLINVQNKTVPYSDYFISTHKINDDLPIGSMYCNRININLYSVCDSRPVHYEQLLISCT